MFRLGESAYWQKAPEDGGVYLFLRNFVVSEILFILIIKALKYYRQIRFHIKWTYDWGLDNSSNLQLVYTVSALDYIAWMLLLWDFRKEQNIFFWFEIQSFKQCNADLFSSLINVGNMYEVLFLQPVLH